MDKWRIIERKATALFGENNTRITESRSQIEIAKRAAGEGAVLLKNENSTLPLTGNESIAVFGKAAADYVKGGEGSGDVLTSYVIEPVDAFEELAQQGGITVYKPLHTFYRENIAAQRKEGCRPGYTSEPVVPDTLFSEAREKCDTAVVFLNRISLENDDVTQKEYYLTENEKALLDRVTADFSKIVIVLNVGAVMDASYFAENPKIGAVLLSLQGGNEGANVINDILFGKICPSGKTVDTWAKSYDDYPSSAFYNVSRDYTEYCEDIYIGYRYFQTIPGAKEKVLYPFGYGLSYTQFKTESKMGIVGDICKITATVTNTGKVSGKQVVEVYYSAPEGKLDKAALELCGFAKTPLLTPGEKCVLEISADINQMNSYDEELASYVLEAGTYRIFVGDNVSDVTLVGSFEKEYTVVSKVKNRCTPHKLSKRLHSDGTYEKLKVSEYEPLCDTSNWGNDRYWKYKHKDLFNDEPKKVDFRNFTNEEDVIKLIDVFEGKKTIDEFVNQLDLIDLIYLSSGCPNQGIANTSGIGDIREFGIPAAMTTDGPAGVRLVEDAGVTTTAFPSGTTLASTWNTDLVTEVATAASKEVVENGFALWLAPGMNIHRNPLCGRNFEYYSEDPYVAGKIAAAFVNGVQSLGISACIKHFACNNKEDNRYFSDSVLSERALREIYLKSFRIAIDDAKPLALMTSYNLVNGRYSPENSDLVGGILREEWEYDGLVVADWGSQAEPYREILAKNNVHMPCSKCDHLCTALENGLITREMLQENAKYVLNFLMKLA